MSKKIFVAGVVLFCGLILALVPEKGYSGTPRSGAAIACDEHPWDLLKRAYRYEILQVTDEYVIVAVWFDEEQVEPIIYQFKRKVFENPPSFSNKSGYRSGLISLE